MAEATRSIPPKIYSSTKTAKQHYNRIIGAKSRVQSHNNNLYSLSIRNRDPIKVHELITENNRILTSLIRIIQQPSRNLPTHAETTINSKKSRKKCRKRSFNKDRGQSEADIRRKSLFSSFHKREEQDCIAKANNQLLKRLETIKPTIGHFKDRQRQRQLSIYSKLSRKKMPQQANTQNHIEAEEFAKFRRTLIGIGQQPVIGRMKRRRRRKSRRSFSNNRTSELF